MSQILAVVHRTARGRSTAEYEDLDEQAADSLPSIGSISRRLEDSYDSHIAGADDMEMASVSVVPDGMYNSVWGFFPLYIFHFYTSSECIWLLERCRGLFSLTQYPKTNLCVNIHFSSRYIHYDTGSEYIWLLERCWGLFSLTQYPKTNLCVNVYFSSRHIHCDTGSECIWLRQVSSETVLIYWALLDGRQHGNDDTEHSVTCPALWLAHHTIPAGSDNNSKCLKLLVILTRIWGNIQNHCFSYSTVVCIHH